MKYFLIAVFTLAVALPCFGENNLANPGFEELTPGKLPVGWGIGLGTGREVVKENGSSALKLCSQVNYGKNRVSVEQGLPDVPGSAYTLSGKVKGNINLVYAVLQFTKDIKPPTTLVEIKRDQMQASADGWLTFTKQITVPKGNKALTLILQPCTEEEGEAVLLDDLSLTSVAAAAPPVPAAPKAPAPADVSFVPAVNGTLVAHPAAASQVVWPVHPVAGKDFWQLLKLDWRELDGVKDEPFVQNSGCNIANLYYANRGVVRGDLRKTKIKEFQIFSKGGSIAKHVSIVFSSEEPDAIFYDIDKIQDGNLDTAGFIIGNSSDFRIRNEAVPFRIDVSQLSGPVEKIRFLTDLNGCNPFAKLEALDTSGKAIDAMYERSTGDLEWTLTFSKPITADSFVIRGETAPSLYKVVAPEAKYRDLLERVTGVRHYGHFLTERDLAERFRAKSPVN